MSPTLPIPIVPSKMMALIPKEISPETSLAIPIRNPNGNVINNIPAMISCLPSSVSVMA